MSRGTAPGPLAVLRGHHAEVQAIDFLEGEQVLLAGDAEGEVKAWDLQELRPVSSLKAHLVSGGVLHLRAFTAGGRQFLITQGKDMTTHIWRLGRDLQLPSQPLHTILKLAASFCRFSLLLPATAPSTSGSSGAEGGRGSGDGVSAQENYSGTAGELGDSSQPPQGSSSPPSAAPEAAAAGPAAGPSLTPVHHCSCPCWLPEEKAEEGGGPAQGAEQPLPQQGQQQQALQQQQGGQPFEPLPLLALPGDDGNSIELWCCGCGQRLGTLGQAARERKWGMCTSLRLFRAPSGGACVAAGYEAGWVAVWALGGGPSSSGPSRGGSGASGACGGGSELAVTGSAAAAIAPGEPLAARQLHEEPVLALDIDSAGTAGASGGADARLVFFRVDFAAGELRVRKAAPLRAPGLNDIALRPDGRITAAGSWDGRVRVFKCRTGEPLAVLKYHQAAVSAVRFGPVTHLLASASRDGTVALWSIYQEQQQQRRQQQQQQQQRQQGEDAH